MSFFVLVSIISIFSISTLTAVILVNNDPKLSAVKTSLEVIFYSSSASFTFVG